MKKHFILLVAILLTAVVIVNGTNDKADDDFTNSSFDGLYKKVLLRYGGSGISTSSITDMTFDGEGGVVAEGFQSTSIPNGAEQPVYNDTIRYSVAPDGSYTFTFPDGGEVVGQLHEDGKSYIHAKVDNNNTQVIVAGIKAESSGFTDASFEGVYKRVLFAFSNGVPRSSIGDLTFDGEGNVSLEAINSTPYGANQPISNSWRYSVNSDGSYTFTFPNGGEVVGQLHEDGKSFIASKIDNNNTQVIIAGIKTGTKNDFSNASFKGVYKRIVFAFGNGVPRSSIGDLTFDGKGNVSLESINSTPDGANQYFTNSWRYSVNPDGSFIFTFDNGGEAVGQLHEDRKSFIAAKIDDNNTQRVIIGIQTDKKVKKEKKDKKDK